MVRGGEEEREDVTSFCEAKMLAQEEGKRKRNRLQSSISRPAASGEDALGVGDYGAISGHRRRKLADGKLWAT